MYAEERQQAIAALVARSARLSVADLAERFRVTTETIRRDLSHLERAGLVRRVHGGVVASQALSVLEVAVSDRDQSSVAEKERIAAAALDLVPEEGCVVIDAGTTTARLARLLPLDRQLDVITHAVPIASRVAGHPAIHLRLLPGQVRPTTQAAVGEDTVAALSRLRADVAFLGTNGVSAGHGFSTPDHAEAAVKRAIVHGARQVVVLADSTKLDQEHLVRFAELTEVDVLVTDDRATSSQLDPLTEAGMKVVVV
jgi:DeoR family transcriptional regulator, fructose operon transcriptional repressor